MWGPLVELTQNDPTVTYPSTLVNNPICKTILEIIQSHLFDLDSDGCAHTGKLNCRLRQTEHAGDRLPAGVRPDTVTDNLLEATLVAMSCILNEFSNRWWSRHHLQLQQKLIQIMADISANSAISAWVAASAMGHGNKPSTAQVHRRVAMSRAQLQSSEVMAVCCCYTCYHHNTTKQKLN